VNKKHKYLASSNTHYGFFFLFLRKTKFLARAEKEKQQRNYKLQQTQVISSLFTIYLIIYSLFSGVFNTSHYMASNDRLLVLVDNELKKKKKREKTRCSRLIYSPAHNYAEKGWVTPRKTVDISFRVEIFKFGIHPVWSIQPRRMLGNIEIKCSQHKTLLFVSHYLCCFPLYNSKLQSYLNLKWRHSSMIILGMWWVKKKNHNANSTSHDSIIFILLH
jgi:hypothetical protein